MNPEVVFQVSEEGLEPICCFRHIRVINELEHVWHKDNIIAHMVRTLGAMDDTLFEYVTPSHKANK